MQAHALEFSYIHHNLSVSPCRHCVYVVPRGVVYASGVDGIIAHPGIKRGIAGVHVCCAPRNGDNGGGAFLRTLQGCGWQVGGCLGDKKGI